MNLETFIRLYHKEITPTAWQKALIRELERHDTRLVTLCSRKRDYKVNYLSLIRKIKQKLEEMETKSNET